MNLSDIIGNMDLATFPKVALVIFAAVFAVRDASCVTLRRRRNRSGSCSRDARIDDDPAEGGVRPVMITTVQLLDHVYDGIEEYDNPVPGWWHVLRGSVSFAFPYVVLVPPEPADLPVLPEESCAAGCRRLQAAEVERLFADIGQLENDEATLVTYMNDPDWMSFAASTFRGNCASCHAAATAGGSSA